MLKKPEASRLLWRAAKKGRIGSALEWVMCVGLASILAATAAAATVTTSGANRSAIAAALHSACKGKSAGRVVIRKGTYFVGLPLSIPANCTLEASAPGEVVLKAEQSQILAIDGDDVNISGLTLDGGWIAFGSAPIYSHFVFKNNTIQNLWNGDARGGPTALSGTTLIDSNISNNSFLNLWGGGSPGYPNSPPVCTTTCDGTGIDSWGSAGVTFSGLDRTIISENRFSEIASDAIHISWEAWTGHINSRPSSGNEISYNTFTKVRRIPIELQTDPSGHCPGGCDYDLTPTTGLQVKGNYIHDFAFPYYDTWGSSLVPDGAVGSLYLNNTFLAEPGSGHGYAPCMESSGRDNLSQGNVCASIPGAKTFFKSGIAQGGGSNPRFKSIYQNSIFCGNAGTLRFDQEPSDPNPNASTVVDQYNHRDAGNCPAGRDLTTSKITASFVSPDHRQLRRGQSDSWNLSVISNLSVRHVQFFLDGATAPVSTQERQDVNRNFASDRKWLYHALIGPDLAAGVHRLEAVCTDVSGARQSVVQDFSITP